MTTAPAPADRSLEVHLLGTVELDAATALMDWLAFDLSGRDDGRGVLLLCEHPVGVSLGAEGSRAELSEAALDGEVPVEWRTRGGGAVVHGPGVLAAYPLLPLAEIGVGVAAFRRRLEEAAAAACGHLKVPAERRADEPGLWGRGGRIAWFGAGLRHGVTTHGLHLCVDPDPGLLQVASRERLTAMSLQRTKPDLMHAARQRLLHETAAAFGYERFHVHTGHEMLRPRDVRRRQAVGV